jgi:hypothetical protein
MTGARRLGALLLAAAAATAASGPTGAAAVVAARPQSVVGVGLVEARPGAKAVVPVWVIDAEGTPLGWDRGTADRIQAFGLRVRCLPAGAVERIAVRRAGVLASVAPMFEAAPAAPDGVSLVLSFDGRRTAVPLVPDGRRRQLVAYLEVTLARSARPGTAVELRLDPEATLLGNQAGTVAETPRNGWLRLRDGAIRVR